MRTVTEVVALLESNGYRYSQAVEYTGPLLCIIATIIARSYCNNYISSDQVNEAEDWVRKHIGSIVKQSITQSQRMFSAQM
jgi:hypothetical protein